MSLTSKISDLASTIGTDVKTINSRLSTTQTDIVTLTNGQTVLRSDLNNVADTIDNIIEPNLIEDSVQQFSAQFVVTGTPIVSIQPSGTFEQRSRNLLDFFTMANKTLSNDSYSGTNVWQITTNANGNFFTFPNFDDKRLNIDIKLSIICTNPPWDKGALVHIKRGLNGTIVDDRSKSTIFQNFSTINPGQISFDIYTLAQGVADPYYQTPNGGFGLQIENVTSSNSYEIVKIKMDCIATVQSSPGVIKQVEYENIDGGTANAIYSPVQQIFGGNA